MEQFQLFRQNSLKSIKLADHMLTITFPVVKDPKLLITILSNIYKSLDSSMSAIVYYDRLFKRIPPFTDEFDSRYTIFRNKSVRLYSIDQKYPMLINQIKTILDKHKKSPIEFVKNNKFVICNEEYKTDSIGVKDIKEFIAQTKEFNEVMEKIIGKNEDIFRTN